MRAKLKNFDAEVDRADPQRAARLFEILWPDESVRRACGQRLAESIKHAHGRASGSWEVTMFAHFVRLNVGQVEVLTLDSEEIRALFRGPLNADVDRRFSVDFDAARPVYPAVPVSSGVFRFDPVHLTAVPQSVWSTHQAFIDAAAEAKKVSPFKKSFSEGVLKHIETLLGSDLPRPSYLQAGERKHIAYDWTSDVRSWLDKQGTATPDVADSVVRFFQLAFENTQCREQAWFGVHRTAVSLVVGGIFLAAVLWPGKYRGFWLLVDQQPPPVEGVKYHPVKSTQRSKFPLTWAHSPSLEVVSRVVANDAVWQSFSAASEKILHAGIAKGRDAVQKRRGKTRLAELREIRWEADTLLPRHPNELERQRPAGAGFGDPEQNRKVEEAAVRVVTEWYQNEGWEVISVESQRCGFDLLCKRDGLEAHVEVKGVAGSERRFIITDGEHQYAKTDDRFVLALVTSAMSESPTLERWSARSFLEQFDFKPIQYWAVPKAK